VIAGAPHGLDPEAVRDEDVAQRRQRQDVSVLPRFQRRRVAGVQGVRISDRSAGGDVRHRERLVAERERDDVVPAGEILGADDRAPAGAEDTADFLNEVVETLDVLDHLVGVNDVERSILERPALVEVADTNVETARSGELDAFHDELEAANTVGRHGQIASNNLGPAAVVAA
jgi:hypothetical protein